MSVVMEVEELVAPLGYNSEGIFDECADNEEASYRWNVSVLSASTGQHAVLSHSSEDMNKAPIRNKQDEATHGFMGSAAVSSHSSSLFVCSRS